MREEDLRHEHVYHVARTDEWLWERARAAGVSRRQFVRLLAAGAVAAGVAAGTTVAGVRSLGRVRRASAAPAGDLVVKPTPPEYFVDFASNKEMRWEVMYGRGYVVPNELFFIRDHSRTPHPGGYASRDRG